MPDLGAQGYRLVAQEADPGGVLTGTDSWRAIFQKGGTAAGTGTQAFRDLYPLPASELIANKKLTQNTGY